MKVAVITGASRGLGLVLANEFADQGWTVLGIGRSERPAQLVSEVDYYQFDASDAAKTEAFWQDVQKNFKDAEFFLVNNAGGYAGGGLVNTKPETFESQMKINYFVAVNMTRGLASVIPKARIINIVSANALAPRGSDAAYGASKAAEKYFFQSLQQEYKADKYQITNLYPSSIATSEPNPKAINPSDLAALIQKLADNKKSYYARDITLYPS